MKKAMTALCLAAVASWVMAAGAQQSTMEQSQKSSTKSAKTVTLTGCLEEGLTPGTYLLKNATGAGDSWSSSTTGTSGTSGTSGMAGESMSGSESPANEIVELMAAKGVDLKAHVGHKVEVTGMPSHEMPKTEKKDSAGTSGSSGTSGTGMSGSGMSGESGSSGMSGSKEQHMLSVKSVKHISDSCGGH
jgi:collagen type VII alpha